MNIEKTHYMESLSYYKIANTLKNYLNKDTIIICIGTDRCIGDCLGPLVGTILRYKNIPLKLYGTLDEPIHALNIEKTIKNIKNSYPNSSIIGIDACLGDKDNIGQIQVRNFPIQPGKGVGKTLPKVGDCSIVGIVDSNENCDIFTSSNTRLSLILNIAKVIANSILQCCYVLDI
ncbi:spore protease YyaC [Clostridium botulinum]|uniref:Spore protease YyaC n=1 Tax=Clostridium botulinum TaxID=1491 RepID=A0AA43Y9J4_CLOBO|nr:spore protease YyaC [Clostridium botulinum]KEI83140.1 sporulation protein [Clostridium botulinum A2 117]KEJ03891.1 sporulation protein [Clostridium botulinum F 357]MBE1305906.1 spore protease YyaC [Clostridium botulinum]MBN3417171.1 spore protease YyaC [Clostridium botulinum]MBN3443583.1 spore protease YyaC [Clostridium botulinum]